MKLDTQLRLAEFKGFKFLIESAEETGGRKIAVFSYANSDKIFIDDLGGLPQDFSISCTIAGVNFLADSQEFRKLLLDKEYGKLVFPSLGTVQAKAVTYRRTESNDSIGEHVYSVQFKLAEMVGSKITEEVTDQEISAKYDEAMDALFEQLLADWVLPTTNANKTNVISDAKAFANTCKEVAGEINAVARFANKVTDTIDTVINVASLYVDLMVTEGPFAGLASLAGIGDAYQACYDMGQFGKDLPDRLQNIASGTVESFTSLGDTDTYDISLFEEDLSADWNERNTSRILQVETVRLQAIGLLMASARGLDLTTVDKITTVRNQIEEMWVGSFENDNQVMTPKVYDIFTDLKELVLKYLNEKEIQAYYTTTIDIYLSSPRALAYLLYSDSIESEDDLEDMQDMLTEENDKPYFEGETEVLQK